MDITHREALLALEENSIRINPGTRVVFPQWSLEEQVSLDRWKAYFGQRVYAVENDVICFLDGVNVYVTPWNSEKEDILRKLLYEKRAFYVPFSHWDYPRDEKEFWEQLFEEA